MKIFGSEYVSNKLIELIDKMEEMGYLKARFVVFDITGFPKRNGVMVYGSAEEDSLGIIVNLKKHISNVVKVTQWNMGAMFRIDHRLWWSLLNTILHEAFENQYILQEKYEPGETQKPTQEEINELAEGAIDALAKQHYNIEPDLSGWLWESLSPHIVRSEQVKPENGDENVDGVQHWMYSVNTAYIDMEERIRIKTFRECRRLMSCDADDPSWDIELEEFTTPQEAPKQEAPKQEAPKQEATVSPPQAENAAPIQDDQIYYDGDDGYIEYEGAQEEEYSGYYDQDIPGVKKPAIDYSVVVVEGLPNNNHIPREAFKTAMVTLANRMHSHVFEKCGWRPQDPGSGFASAWNVVDPIYVADIPYIQEILVGYDKAMVGEGTVGKKTCHPVDWNGPNPGCISGVVFGKTGLPAFNFYVNHHGRQYSRAFIPQNKNGTGKFATLARAGERISYIKDRNTKDTYNNIGAVVGNKSFEFWSKK